MAHPDNNTLVDSGMDILANSARSDDGASDEEGEDRMRDLLASYYGLSNDGPANETNQEMRGSTVSSEQREREVEGDHEIGRDKQVLPTTTHYSMDSQHFQSTQYVRHLLKTSSLSALLRTDDELVYEVKSLDSDMQMLVYENYNKFITATGQ